MFRVPYQNIFNNVTPRLFNRMQKKYGDIVYLNWEDDPTTTMTIQWHSTEVEEPDLKVYYKEHGEENWEVETGIVEDMPYSLEKRKIHWTKIENLKPNTGYDFKFSGDRDGIIRKFKTMPTSLSSPIKVAFTSDCHGHYRDPSDHIHGYFEDITTKLGGTSPDGFDADIIVGVGDYTYDEGRGRSQDTERWVDLLGYFSKYFVNSVGYMIPFIPAIGNHDVNHVTSGAHRRKEDAIHYSKLFAFPTQEKPPSHKFALGSLKFGDYLQLLILDTGTNDYGTDDTEQINFLNENIDSNMKHIIPAYHRAQYGVRAGNSWRNSTISEMFQKPFQDAGVKFSMEGHNHTYNITKQIIDNEVVEDGGITYLGEGTWNNWRAVGEFENMSYILDAKGVDEDQENAPHFWGLELHSNKIIAKSINYKGECFYETERLL